MTAPKSLACVFDAHGVCRLAGCSCPCHQNEFSKLVVKTLAIPYGIPYNILSK